uniref:[histone H3]-trimethyl-L-lysine(9) demethylase n=1 Tax=Denticeps clupeoides TaxID=299321 RepID=A0AAY4B6W7_9TELE
MSSDSTPQNSVSRIMTFHPTKEEFKGFSRYIAYIESQGAHKAGMAKIVPPKDWTPRQTYDDIDDLVIPVPIQQVVTGQSGLFTQYNIQKKPMTVREFRRIANTDRFCNPRYVDFDELERKYWKNLTFNPPLYGADISGSLYDPNVTEWNIGQLNTILDTVERESGIKIKGVNTPYLYFGMWKSTFAWHTEDMDLYSINYLHFGEPKSWYCVPPEHGKRLERLAKGFFPGSAQSCEAFLRHKMTLISPSILKKYGIPFEKVTQEAGEFIVTFPYAYHAGFNHGFNCAESTNFATQRWIDYGKQATLCSCRKDMVKISMDLFVRKFQPERYKLWEAGKDNTPIDHSKPTPEAAEFFIHVHVEEDSLEPIEIQPTGDKSEDQPMVTDHQSIQGNHLEENPEQGTEETTPEKEPVGSEPEEHLEVQSMEESPVHKQPTDGEPPEGHPEKMDTAEVMSVEQSLTEANPADAQSMDVQTVNPESSEVEPEEEVPVEAGPADSTEELMAPCPAAMTSKEEKPVEQQPTAGDGTEPKENPVADTSTENEGAQNRLTKLPRHHPLMKDSMSDEELQDQAAVDEDGLEGELWAKPLTHLWQNRHCSLEKEKEYNRSMGLQRPYCAVCMLFQTYQRCGEGEPAPPVGPAGKQRTKPLIPEMCFSTTTEDSVETHLSTPYLEEDGTSLLISCAQCCVRVHTSCYGINPKSVTKGWKCTRCKANAMTESCCLCSLRGGALHRANNDKWVHVLCAVAVLEARFVNITRRSPVDLSGIPLQRFKLKCYYCKRRMKKTSGCCVQCSHGRCPTSYHPTCAQAAGPVQTESLSTAMRELTVGQKVICKHKNGRYYQCDVVQLSKETFYEVNFDDGSFSDNLFPEDIVNRDCSLLGPPAQGEVVQVRWTDGLVYGAKFVAAHVIQMYQVEFEDGSQLTAKRDDVYTLDEELPKRVKSRLSKASDMRFDEMFGEKKVQETKRQRVINSRYRGDYIEPVIYRAIME